MEVAVEWVVAMVVVAAEAVVVLEAKEDIRLTEFVGAPHVSRFNYR